MTGHWCRHNNHPPSPVIILLPIQTSSSHQRGDLWRFGYLGWAFLEVVLGGPSWRPSWAILGGPSWRLSWLGSLGLRLGPSLQSLVGRHGGCLGRAVLEAVLSMVGRSINGPTPFRTYFTQEADAVPPLLNSRGSRHPAATLFKKLTPFRRPPNRQ